MASELHISERVYRAVKAELLGPSFAPGEKIEAVELARRHIASITPVRAALHRLTGEGLVDARAGEGFHAPVVTEVSLRDLYAWNGQIIQLAYRLSANVSPLEPEDASVARYAPAAVEMPQAISGLFAAIGERSGNEQCALAIGHLNDQLHRARRLEGEVIKALDDEFRDLADTIRLGHSTAVRHAITTYHRRRIRLAADLVRLMHRRRHGTSG